MEIDVPSLVRVKPNALHRLGKYLRNEGFTEVSLVLGKGIEELVGDQVRISFAAADITACFSWTALSNNLSDVFEEAQAVPRETKALVAIGGGKAIDCAKFLGNVLTIPVVSVPTITSNDGFASPLASLVVNGKRQTMKTEIPHAVILDTEIIRAAPAVFHYSGMGDLFCKKTAIFDWKLAFKKVGETVNDFAVLVSQTGVDTFAYYRDKDLQQPAFHGIIASALLMNGVAMEIAGSSRPASGSEHCISHAYDEIAPRPSLHGLQVGVASYAVSFVQGPTHEPVKAIMQDCGFADFMAQQPLDMAAFIEAVQRAPTVKSHFYSILSEPGVVPRLIEFIERDELMNQMVKAT